MDDYIIREAFIAEVEEWYCGPCLEYGYDLSGDWCRDCVVTRLLKMVRDAPAADVEPVRRWIPVHESLPEKNGAYLVANDIDFIGVRSFAVEKRFDLRQETLENVWWYLDDEWEDQIATGITHWMPLPAPPAKDSVEPFISFVDESDFTGGSEL